jgi:Na+/melibiose symporter-like transporter
MTPRNLAYLALRILPLVLLILQFQTLAGLGVMVVARLVEASRYGGGWVAAFVTGGLLLFYLIGLWLVWRNAHWISRKVYPYEDEQTPLLRMRPAEVEPAVYSIIGLIFGLSGIISLSRSVAAVFFPSYWMPDATWLDWLLSGLTFAALIQLGLGLVLMLYSRGIVRWMRRLRTAGHGSEPPPAEPDAISSNV